MQNCNLRAKQLIIFIGVVLGLMVPLAYSSSFSTHSWPKLSPLYSNDEVMNHLRELERIAEQNEGNRAAGTSGFEGSVEYLLSYLSTYTSFIVSTQTFPFYHYTELSVPLLSQLSPASISYTYNIDFTALRNSYSGDVTATLHYGGECCTTAEIGNTSGEITICEYNGCAIEEKVKNAIEGNAAAIFIVNNPGEGVNSGTLDDPVDRIVFGIRSEVGREMIAMSPPPVFHAKAEIELIADQTVNIIADAPVGDENSVFILGSHLDSVKYGPGINDDGSGSSALMEIARSYSQYLTSSPPVVNRLRLCWFGAEELGKIGSRYYVNSLISNSSLSSVAAYYNFDMIASPNFYRGVFSGSTTPEALHGPSTKLQNLLEEYFEFSNLPYLLISFGEGSDYYYFLQNGVPAGGLHTGTNLPKPPTYRSLFGGIARAGFDPCYHEPCDSFLNANPIVLEQNGKAAFYVAIKIGEIPNLKEYLNSPSPSLPRLFLVVDDDNHYVF